MGAVRAGGIWRWLLAGGVAAALVVPAPGALAGPPGGLHCEGHDDPANVKLESSGEAFGATVTIQGGRVVFSEPVSFCAKGGRNFAGPGQFTSGPQTGTGYQGNQDISYVVVYPPGTIPV